MTTRKRLSRRRHEGAPLQVVRAFIRSINCGNVDRLASLVSQNHLFTDSLGHQVVGSDAIRAAFAGYFQMVPDYRIKVTEALVERNVVLLVGLASGSYVAAPDATPVGTWRTPAAWRAVVRQGRIAEWQVYADNEPIRELMRQRTHAAV